MLGWLLALFVVVPLAELVILLRLGEAFGFVPTLALIIGTGILGASLARWQGFATWRRVQRELAAGRLPGNALLDGLLILIAGTLLLTPGLLTDCCGFLLLAPPVRALLRRRLLRALRPRIVHDDTVVLDADWHHDDD